MCTIVFDYVMKFLVEASAEVILVEDEMMVTESCQMHLASIRISFHIKCSAVVMY